MSQCGNDDEVVRMMNLGRTNGQVCQAWWGSPYKLNGTYLLPLNFFTWAKEASLHVLDMQWYDGVVVKEHNEVAIQSFVEKCDNSIRSP